jgi:lipopolysaccharide biosynthesis protein
MKVMVETRTILAPKEMSQKCVCVFVSYSPTGHIKPHVKHHLDALNSVGFQCVLVLVVDRFVNKSYRFPSQQLAGCVIRLNAGFDFGAWADTFRLFPQLWQAKRLLIVNDSIIGPLSDFSNFMSDVLDVKADVVGLTESWEVRRHFQSFFLLFNSTALKSSQFRSMWASIENLKTKTDVIAAYETNFVLECERRGLTTMALYPEQKEAHRGNRTIFHWRSLLELGFPYIKIELLRDLLSSRGREDLLNFCYDEALAKIITEI